jgi:hypothetical protein
MTRAVTTDALYRFTYRQPISKIRCATHLMHAGMYPGVGVTALRSESPFGVVTMSVHKLTAGSGYDYLTRQVAALDATEKGHIGLASYYTERGESPGVWIGSGLAARLPPQQQVRLRSPPRPAGAAPPRPGGRQRHGHSPSARP